MLEEEVSLIERDQVRRLITLQKILLEIFRKWFWVLVIVFFGLLAGFSYFLIDHSAHSIRRFSASVRMLYTPRSTASVHAINERELLGILDRPSLKRKVGTILSLSDMERMCLLTDLIIQQDRKRANFFMLTASAPLRKAADKKVNTYAEVLISEYAAYRSNDLKKWYESLEQRKQSLQERIAALDTEEKMMKGEAGVVSPVETLTLLNGLISDQRRNCSLLNVQIANEEVKKKRLQEEIGELGPIVSECAPLLHRKRKELEAIDAELTKLREMYTDINPKVLGKLDDRKIAMNEYQEILKNHGIEDEDFEDLEHIEKAVHELDEISRKMEVLSESKRSIESEIKQNEEKCKKLTAAIPVLERIATKRNAIEKNLQELNSQQGDLEYLMLTSSSDLQVIDNVEGAGQLSPLRFRNLLLPPLATIFCTFALFSCIALLEFFFGKLRNLNELAAYDDVKVLGALPKPNAISADMEKDIQGVVALNFCRTEIPKEVVLMCRLTRTKNLGNFATIMEWSLYMAGVRSFWLEVVPGSTFEPPENSKTLSSVVRLESHGWLPVANRYVLLPSECEMLKADLETLRNDFENVFIEMPEGIRNGGSFLGQLLELCDSALLLVRAGGTLRSDFRSLHRRVVESGKPMMGIIAGVSNREVKLNMEQ